MKKMMQLVTVMIVTAAMFTQVFAAGVVEKAIQFTDVNATHWANESIQTLVKAGYIKGYTDGTFKPEGEITRPELVRIVNQVFGYTQKQETTNFTDVKLGSWYYNDVLIAQNSGYIHGYPDNTFKPENNITREQLCVVLDFINKFVELPYDRAISDEVSPWATQYVNRIVSNRIMPLDANNNFRAKNNATRAEVCVALAKFVVLGTEPVTVVPDTVDTQQEIYDAMVRVTGRLTKNVIPELTTVAQKEMINAIIANMNAYKNDNDYDYKTAAGVTYEKYKLMSQEEKDTLLYWIQISNPTKDLLILKDFFFPNMEI